MARVYVLSLAVLHLVGCGGDDTATGPGSSNGIATVEVTPNTATLTSLGETARLTATAKTGGGDPVSASFTWESGDTSVAVVTTGGVVTSVSNGVAQITARASGVSGTAVATVMQRADSLAVILSQGFIRSLGDTVDVSWEAFDALGHAVPGEASVTSLDPTLVSIVGDNQVVGLTRGFATIQVELAGATARAEVDVDNWVAINGGVGNDIIVQRPFGEDRWRFSTEPAIGPGQYSFPEWRPDGEYLAVARAEPETGAPSIRVVDVAGRSVVFDLSTDQVFGLAWSPGGDRLAFVTVRWLFLEKLTVRRIGVLLLRCRIPPPLLRRSVG